MNADAHAPCGKFTVRRKSRVMIRYPEISEVIHNGSKPPKLGTYTPPLPYLVVKGDSNDMKMNGLKKT